MKRIDIVYGGQLYSVGGREVSDLLDEVTSAVREGGGWIRVNDGEGERREAFLFVAPGTSVAVVPIPDQTGEA